jgi:hypothetical protein
MESAELPKWKCHKEVKADRIVKITPGWHAAPTHAEYGDRWVLACGLEVLATRDLTARGTPQVGDYFVQYDDGYQSWSPAKAFEEGYTRL